MKWKIIFLLLVLILVVGAGCEKASDNDNKKDIEETNTDNKDSEFYDGLDDALNELDELEDL